MRRVISALCFSVAVAAAAADIRSLMVTRHGDAYRVTAEAYLAAPPAAVYAVLTDYAHLTRISGVVKKSEVINRLAGGVTLVYTDSQVCALIFCKHVIVLQRYSTPDVQDIVAEVVPAGSNLKMGQARWHMEPEAGGTLLKWSMTAVPGFWVPPFIGPALIERGLRIEGRRGVTGVERLARERAHLPPLDSEPKYGQENTNRN